MKCFLIFVLVLCISFASALNNFDPEQECLDGIQTAVASFTFASEYNEGGYYANFCNNTLGVHSMWAAAKTYCTPKEIVTGTKLIESYCAYGPITLTSYEDVLPDLTEDYVASMQRVDFDDIDATKIWNSSILILPQFYTQAYRTTYTFNEEMLLHTSYGWAMYGFWGTILLIGIINRFVNHTFSSRSSKTNADIENNAGNNAAQRHSAGFRILQSPYHWVRANLIIPAAYGSHHQQLFWWCSIPTRMETLVLMAYWSLSIVLCVVNIDTFYPNLYYTLNQQTWRYIADRTGIICYANLPIMWIFSGRNNVFLWATGWSFSTFNIFHRHIARVATIQAIIHSILYSILEAAEGGFKDAWTQQYWYMGGMATIVMSLLLVFSSVFRRQKAYELFLIIHIALSVATIVGLFYHTAIFDGEYNGYLWPLVAIWVFDRAARAVRQIYCNFHVKYSGSISKTSTTATFDANANMIRLEVIPGSKFITPKPNQHYFLYQPLRWRGWENHPFTLASWEPAMTPDVSITQEFIVALDMGPDLTHGKASIHTTGVTALDYKSSAMSEGSARVQTKLIFYIRPFSGWTKSLLARCQSQSTAIDTSQKIPISCSILLEGPYGHSYPLHTFETLIFITGGTGIAGATSYIKDYIDRSSSSPVSTKTTHVHLVWATKQEAMIHNIAGKELASALCRSEVTTSFFVTSGTPTQTPAAELSFTKEVGDSVSGLDHGGIIHYGRPDIKKAVLDVIESEKYLDKKTSAKIAVLVCGPAGMADEARATVQGVLERGWRGVDYFEETFGW